MLDNQIITVLELGRFLMPLGGLLVGVGGLEYLVFAEDVAD